MGPGCAEPLRPGSRSQSSESTLLRLSFHERASSSQRSASHAGVRTGKARRARLHKLRSVGHKRGG